MTIEIVYPKNFEIIPIKSLYGFVGFAIAVQTIVIAVNVKT